MSRRKVVVGSGWWSDRAPHDWTIGTQDTHNPKFFRTWLKLVRRYLAPDRIVITDSHAPIKPAERDRSGIEWIELDRNYGHANDIRVGRIQTKYSGYMRSVVVGATYALACDADYFVYVEQDCVIHGDGLLDAIIGGMEHPIALGAHTVGGVGISGPAAPMLQTSLMVVANVALERFITAILLAPESDGALSPEMKLERDLQPFSYLPIPFGRSRPLDFSRPHFYAQHLMADELSEFLRREPAVPGSAGSEKATEGVRWLNAWSVELPVLREIFECWRRRPALRRMSALERRTDIERLVQWALVDGVHEEPALAELSSEVAVAFDWIRRPSPEFSASVVPRRIHIVSLSTFPDSFRYSAESLSRGLARGGADVEYHADVAPRELASLALVPAGEVVHVVGQDTVGDLLHSAARNWVLTIHGAAPFAMPSELHPPPGPYLEDLRANAHLLSRVICPSYAARREIAAAYGLPLAKIEPVPHFFDMEVYRPEGGRYDAGRPYFLLVSNYQPVKNYVGVLDGFARFAEESEPNVLLLIAGGLNPALDELLAAIPNRWPGLAERVEFVGHARPSSVDPQAPDLAALYRGALALVSASHHETFGMPYIEAALCGTPVIGPKRSIRGAAWSAQATQEILSDAGLYIDPEWPQDLAAMMACLANQAETRARVAERCLERAVFYVEPTFVWRRYMHVYGKVLTTTANA